MKYELKEDDYLKLWTHFQNNAVSVKGALFKTITWVIGFAAALLAFVFANLVDFDAANASLSFSMLMLSVSGAGLAICVFAFFAIGESAKHIKNNWDYADRCMNQIKGLKKIVLSKEAQEKASPMPIWKQLGIVVFLFFVAFIFILATTLVTWSWV